MPVRLDHVTVAAPDPGAVIAFYDAALGALGLVRLDELVDEEEDEPDVEAVAWGAPGTTAVLWVVAGEATTGVHVRLSAGHRADVEAFHAAAVDHGGRSRSAPRRWTPYRRGEFAATVLDPLGNRVEVVAPE